MTQAQDVASLDLLMSRPSSSVLSSKRHSHILLLGGWTGSIAHPSLRLHRGIYGGADVDRAALCPKPWPPENGRDKREVAACLSPWHDHPSAANGVCGTAVPYGEKKAIPLRLARKPSREYPSCRLHRGTCGGWDAEPEAQYQVKPVPLGKITRRKWQGLSERVSPGTRATLQCTTSCQQRNATYLLRSSRSYPGHVQILGLIAEPVLRGMLRQRLRLQQRGALSNGGER